MTTSTPFSTTKTSLVFWRNSMPLGMETKAEFLYRLKWNVEVPTDQVAEQLFAEHIWKEVLNKSDATDYQKFWEQELAQSFLVVRTQDNAYFLKRNHG